MDAMKDKLVKILMNVPRPDFIVSGMRVGKTLLTAERVADHLLAEGVIVPSNKPLPLIDEGDRVLCPICETDLMGCYLGYEESPTVITCYGCGAWLDSTKAVDREEAERALKGADNEQN